MKKNETAILSGGCFWGVEELVRKLDGVQNTEVGYCGGEAPKATYQDVKTGLTGHAESLHITFDPQKLSYENLLIFFFQIHNPTTLNQQGNDIGSQYRSAIFYTSEEQKTTAEKVIARVNKSGAWKAPVVTELVKFEKFYPAENYHQDYLQKNPEGYTCHFFRPLKF